MVPQALAPAGAEPSPRQLSFTFRASPFMSFLLTFFYLSPGQAPNWKTETQTGVGKPVLPRESTGARGHRREKQTEKAPGFPGAPRSCSDLQTLVKFSLLISSQTSFLSVSFPLIPRKRTENGLFRLQKPFLGSSQTTLSRGWMFLKFSPAVTTLPLVVYVIFLEGAQDLNILKLINASKNHPLPQGILGKLCSKVPQ